MGPIITPLAGGQVADFASLFLTVLFFGIASVYDLRTREVPDRVWISYGLIGATLTFYRLFVNPSNLTLTITSVAVGTLISFGMNYFGLFGGADAKAIICLSLTVPVSPESIQPMFHSVLPFFPLEVIITGFLLALSISLWFGLRNLATFLFKGSRMFSGFQTEPLWKKLLAALTGYQTSLAKLRSTFYLYPLEAMVRNSNGPRRVFRLFESAEEDRDKLMSRFMKSYAKVGLPRKVWVTPGLPMIAFFLIAVIVDLIIGDPIFAIMIRR